MLNNGIERFLEIFLGKKGRLIARLEEIQKTQESIFSRYLEDLEEKLIAEYNVVLEQEEIL